MLRTSSLLFVAIMASAFALTLVSESAGQRSAKEAYEGPFFRFDAEHDVNQWLVDEPSGRIFAAIPSTGKVVEYDHGGKQVRQFDMPNTPQRMIIKRNQLIVAMGGGYKSRRTRGEEHFCTVARIPLDTNQVSDELKVNGTVACGLFCSGSDTPYVGGLTLAENPGVYQIDLDHWFVRAEKTIVSNRGTSPTNAAMSADGNWLVLDSAGIGSSGAELYAFDEAKCELSSVTWLHSSYGTISAGPASRFWLFGDKLFETVYDKAPVKDYQQKSSGGRIHPRLDLIAVSNDLAVTLQRFSDDKKFVTAPLNLTPSEKSRKARTRSAQPTQIFFDHAGSLFHCSQNTCQITTLKKLEVAPPELLLIQVNTDLELKIGEALKLPVSLLNPQPGAQVRMEDARPGVQFRDQVIHWTPTLDQLGQHKINLTVASGDRSDAVQVKVAVSVPEVAVDFEILRFKLSRDGRRAICWGRNRQPSNGRTFDTMPRELAVIDLVQHRVLARKSLPNGLLDVAINDKYAYVTIPGQNSIVRLDRDTLSNPRVKNLPYEATRLFAIPTQHIATFSQSQSHSQSKVAIFDGQSLERLSETSAPQFQFQSGQLFQSFSDRYSIAGNFYDSESGELLYSEVPNGLPTLVNLPTLRNLNQSPHHNRSSSRLIWGRLVDQGTIKTRSGRNVHSPQHHSPRGIKGHAVSLKVPVAYFVSSKNASNHDSPRVQVQLECKRLFDGKSIATWNIQTQRGRSQRFDRSLVGQGRVAMTQHHIVVAKLSSLLVSPVFSLNEMLDKSSTPLHITRPESKWIGTDAKQSIQIGSRGGVGEVLFSLKTEYAGLDIDPQSGLITVDTPTLWNNYLQRRPNANSNHVVAHRDRQGPAPINPSIVYQRLTGQKLGKEMEAASLPIHVVVSDDAGQIDEVNFFVTVKGSVAEHNRKREQATRKANARRRRDRQLQDISNQAESVLRNIGRSLQEASELHEQNQRKAPTDKPQTRSYADRLDDIEKRIRRMEATAESILRKLDDRDPPKNRLPKD